MFSKKLNAVSTDFDGKNMSLVTTRLTELQNSMRQMELNQAELRQTMNKALQNQSQILATLHNSKIADFTGGGSFPLRNMEDLENIEKDIQTNSPKYVTILKNILKNDLAANFDSVLSKKLITTLNYDGVNGKGEFKKYEHLNEALFCALKRDGYTERHFVKDIRQAFKRQKGRISKQRYDEKHKPRKKAKESVNDNKLN